MEYALASVFGLGVGVLFAYAAFPTYRWLPSIAAAAVLATGVGESAWGPSGSPWLGIIIGVTSVIAMILASGVRWADHPLLATSGYWSRVGAAALHGRTLQRSWLEYTRDENEDQQEFSVSK
jgi:hypothetical protein